MEFLSLLALTLVIVVSCVSKVNPGFLSLALAWLLGYYGAGLSLNEIARGFPVYIFLVLVGVTHLFGLAKINGTLERLSQSALSLVRGNALAVPVLFFVLAAILSTAGAGNIGAVALLAPVAMIVAWETGIGAFLMTIVVVAGANAGAFSPFALTGIIANGLIADLKLSIDPWTQVYAPNFFAQAFLAIVCYIIFLVRLKVYKKHLNPPSLKLTEVNQAWTSEQKFTLSAIIILIVGGVFLKADVGFMAIALGCVLTLFKVADSKEAVKHIPWNTIIMVCGVNTLIEIMERVGGLDLLIDLLAKVATPQNVTAVAAFITGIISAFSSSTGVVLPTFLPLVPGLIEKIGGGNPIAIVSSINVGAHLVDISPLSSLGALCVASALHEDRDKLFRSLLIFGLSMALVGAVICYALFGWMK